MSYGGSGGGSGRISTSADVALSNVSDSDVLSYDASTQKWKNTAVPTVTPATVGSASSIPVITYDAKGRITATSSVAVSGSSGGSSGVPGWVNVKDYGAVGNGGTDDTSAIEAAAAAAFSTSGPKALYFPGGNYLYNGTGINPSVSDWVIFGAGISTTSIYLGTNSYFVKQSSNSSIDLHSLTVNNGLGIVRDTYTGVNVRNIKHIHDCIFQGYTKAAISNQAADQPYWHIENCVFNGGNDTTSVGIALSGDAASSVIEKNAFVSYRVGIKLGHGSTAGGGVTIRENDFIRLNGSPTVPRADLWVVPSNGGDLRVSANKFGPENIQTTDYHVLFADEASGGDQSDQSQVFWTMAASSGSAAANLFTDNISGGQGNPYTAPAFITSTTTKLAGLIVDNIHVVGTLPASVVYFTNPPTVGDASFSTIVVGPIVGTGIAFDYMVPASNVPGMAQVVDYTDQFMQAETVNARPGGSDASGYVELAAPQMAQLGMVGGATLTSVTDGLGGSNAVEVTFSSSSQSAYCQLNAVTTGIPFWIELDLKAGSSSSLSYISIGAGYNGTSRYGRMIKVPSAWTRFRFPVTAIDQVNQLFFRLGLASSGTVRIGRVRVYHAHEPVMADLALPSAATTTTAPSAGGAGSLPATPAGYMTVYINGAPRKLAYY